MGNSGYLQTTHCSRQGYKRIDESHVRIVKCKERLSKIQQGLIAVFANERNRPYVTST